MESALSLTLIDSGLSSKILNSNSNSSAFNEPAPNTMTPRFNNLEAVYELHRPSGGPPSVELVFFHGLQFGDYSEAYIKTWIASNQSRSWLTGWLVERFPRGRVLSVSYDSSVQESTAKDGSLNVSAVGEKLVYLLEIENVGDNQCPVVLIGHSLGGLVVKEVCIHLERLSRLNSKSPQVLPLKRFLRNIKGAFFYATPNGGCVQAELAVLRPPNPFFATRYLEALNEDQGRTNEEFSKLRRKYGWKTFGVGETDETIISATASVVLVGEECASPDMDIFSKIPGTNHITICQPEEKTSESFLCLVEFVANILRDQEEAESEDLLLNCGLPEHAVSLDARVEHVVEKLQLRDAEPLMLALVGMGGVGKTTLARALFLDIRSLFDYTTFVFNTKESLRLRSLELLIGENLYKGEKKDTRSNSAQSVWKILKGKKVLLIVDNVDGKEQISSIVEMVESRWFGKGTRVIITSRNRSEELLADFVILEVHGLNHEESKKLFCGHAGDPDVPEELVNLVVERCRGLPLTLEVVGAYLRNKTNVAFWEESVERLRRAESMSGTADDRLWNKLRMCLENLSTTEQEMFLDLATVFYDHHDLDLLKAAWRRTMVAPEVGLKNLVDMCLIRVVRQATKNDVDCGLILKRETVWMHAQLRDLGQILAADTHPKVLLTCSNGQEDHALQRLQSLNDKRETQTAIKGLNLSYSEKRQSRDLRTKLPLSFFANMTELQYLFLESVDVSGLSGKFPPNLSLLCLHHCRRVITTALSWHNWPIRDSDLASLSKLAALEISTDSKKDYPDAGNGFDSQGSKCNLPVGFHKLSKLRVFLLRSSAVKELPSKFGWLPRLEYLDLRAPELTALPDSFGSLSSLEKLCLQCRSMNRLPDAFGNLRKLKFLEIHALPFKELPASFGNLSALTELHLYSCQKLLTLPDNFRQLSKLERVVLSCCNYLTLPNSFTALQGLQNLEIRYCESMKELPASFGQLQTLESLKLLHFYELGCLPASFGQLCSLQYLELCQCLGLRKLPSSFGDLRALRKLKIIDCYDLQELPVSFGQLFSLQDFVVHRCQLRSLPDSFVRLKSLQFLKLEKLPSLRGLPDSFGQLSALQNLSIWQCENLPELPVTFGQLRSLQKLEMELHCRLFTKLPESFGRLPDLQRLRIVSCHLRSLPESFGSLSALERMSISFSKSVRELPVIPESFEQLAALHEFTVEVPPTSVGMDGIAVFLEKLEDLGWICTRGSEEGMYTFARVSRHPPSVFDFAHYMHKRLGVECVCATPPFSSTNVRRSREL